MEKRYSALERTKRTTYSSEQYRDAKRAYELLTNVNIVLPSKQARVVQPRQEFVMKVVTSRTQLPVIDEPQVLYARLDFQPLEMAQSTAERVAAT